LIGRKVEKILAKEKKFKLYYNANIFWLKYKLVIDLVWFLIVIGINFQNKKKNPSVIIQAKGKKNFFKNLETKLCLLL
jgi:hypothetical protein